MIKSVIFSILIFCLFACKQNNIPVQEIKSQKNTYFFNAENELLRKTELFDSSGNLIREIAFGSRPRDTISIIDYIYSDNLLTQRIEKNGKGKIISSIHNHYHTGILKYQFVLQGEDTVQKKSFKFYENGKLKRELTEFPMDKDIPIVTVCNYDGYGNIESIYHQIYEDSTRLVISRYEMYDFKNTYNDLRKLIKTESTHLFGYYEIPDLLSITTYAYDDRGYLIREVNEKKLSKEMSDSTHFNYTETGLLQTKIEYRTLNQLGQYVSVADSITYLYDANGRLQSENSSLKETGFRYEYIE